MLAFKDATDNANRDEYKQTRIDNQRKQLKEWADEDLTHLKDNLIAGGQIGSSTGWNKIGKFTDSYMDSLNDINANADINALNYQNALLNYANALQSAMNGYYDISSSTAQTAANNQQNAAAQNLQYANFLNNGGRLWDGLSSATSLLGGLGTFASSRGGLAKKTGGK